MLLILSFSLVVETLLCNDNHRAERSELHVQLSGYLTHTMTPGCHRTPTGPMTASQNHQGTPPIVSPPRISARTPNLPRLAKGHQVNPPSILPARMSARTQYVAIPGKSLLPAIMLASEKKRPRNAVKVEREVDDASVTCATETSNGGSPGLSNEGSSGSPLVKKQKMVQAEDVEAAEGDTSQAIDSPVLHHNYTLREGDPGESTKVNTNKCLENGSLSEDIAGCSDIPEVEESDPEDPEYQVDSQEMMYSEDDDARSGIDIQELLSGSLEDIVDEEPKRQESSVGVETTAAPKQRRKYKKREKKKGEEKPAKKKRIKPRKNLEQKRVQLLEVDAKPKVVHVLPDDLKGFASDSKRSPLYLGTLRRQQMRCAVCFVSSNHQCQVFLEEAKLIQHWRSSHLSKNRDLHRVQCPVHKCKCVFGVGTQATRNEILATERALVDHLVHSHRVSMPGFYQEHRCPADGCNYVAVTNGLLQYHQRESGLDHCPQTNNNWWHDIMPEVPPTGAFKGSSPFRKKLKDMPTAQHMVKRSKGYKLRPMISSLEPTWKDFPSPCYLCQVKNLGSMTMYSDKRELCQHILSSHIVENNKKSGTYCMVCNHFFSCNLKLDKRRGVQMMLGFYIRHMHTYHSIPLPDYLVSCKCPDPDCNEHFIMGQTMQRHYDKMHQNAKATCSVCAATVSLHGMYCHMKLHYAIGVMLFCPSCPKLRMTNSYALRRHILDYHEGWKDSQCPVCKVGRSCKESLLSHMYSSHGLNPENRPVFSCDQCNFTCIYPQMFRAHQKTHLSQREFACDKCDKAFKTKGNHYIMYIHNQ